ncbi:hypothetical protein OSB04_013984 [Centaurea solstitialis]|uniref:non-specific serine/threonine protein kinase n=1 Tax=Centaurea solstitialis TaxID=347529 RepID=A0AA38WNW1_9ASTR|nr:hypothetical protein OSB04_013984 [Centaurea solstitialis]
MEKTKKPSAAELLRKILELEERHVHLKQKMSKLMVSGDRSKPDHQTASSHFNREGGGVYTPGSSSLWPVIKGSRDGGPEPFAMKLTETQYWNVIQSQASENLYGFTPDEAYGKTPTELLVEDPKDAVLADYLLTRTVKGESWSGEFPVRNKSGKNIMVIATNTPFRDENRRLVGGMCVSSDARLYQASRVKLKMKKRDGYIDNEGGNEVTTSDHSEESSLTPRGRIAPSPLAVFNSIGTKEEHLTVDSKRENKHKILSSKSEAWMRKKGIVWPWKEREVEYFLDVRIDHFGWHRLDINPKHEHGLQLSSCASAKLECHQPWEDIPLVNNKMEASGLWFTSLHVSSTSSTSSSSSGKGNAIIKVEREVDYEILWEDLITKEQIGKGSYGTVYRALWYGSDVTVKLFVHQEYSDDVILSFKQEVTLMKRLRHPNILLFMGAVTSPPHLCIVTEFLPRGSLFGILQRNTTRLDWKKRLHMAMDIARGMNYLHRCNPPIIHRDLKSSNLLVDKNWTVKVGDFGLSRVKHETYLKTKIGKGTPQWMAPELLRDEQANEKSDVYSYGVVLWEITTEKIPWDDLNPMQVIEAVGFMDRQLEIPKDVDPLWDSLIQSCWCRKPSAEELLRNILELEEKHVHLKKEMSKLMVSGNRSKTDHQTASSHRDGEGDGVFTPGSSSLWPVVRGSRDGVPEPFAMKLTETQYWNVMQTMGQAIHIFDLTGRIFFWSQTAESLYGFTPDEAYGKTPTELLVEDPKDAVLADYLLMRTEKERKNYHGYCNEYAYRDENRRLIGGICVTTAGLPNIGSERVNLDPQQPSHLSISSKISNFASKVKLKMKKVDEYKDDEGGSDVTTSDHSEESSSLTPRGHIAPSPFAVFNSTGTEEEHLTVDSEIENKLGIRKILSSKAEAWMGKRIVWPWKQRGVESFNARLIDHLGWHRLDLNQEREQLTSFAPPKPDLQLPENNSLVSPKMEASGLWLSSIHVSSSSSSSSSSSNITSNAIIKVERETDYEILWEDLITKEQIGQGSCGTVYHGLWHGSVVFRLHSNVNIFCDFEFVLVGTVSHIHVDLCVQDVAVKLFVYQEYSDDVILSFRKEVALMKRLRHPNILLFMGAVTSPPHLSIVTEFLPRLVTPPTKSFVTSNLNDHWRLVLCSGSLFRVLQRNSTRLDWRRRLHMAVDIARGMNYLHQCNPPIIHRDLKSQIFLSIRIGPSRHETYLKTKTGKGTPQWMAPEILRNEQANEKSDVYSYGVVCGKLPPRRSHGTILIRCRVHESTTRDSKRFGSNVGFSYRKLLVQNHDQLSKKYYISLEICKRSLQPNEGNKSSCGTVYHGLWHGSDVAIKLFVHQEYSDDVILSFRKEVALMKRLRHPNILLFMGAVTTPPHLSIVTEFLPRGSLFRVLQRNSTRLDWRRRLHMAVDIARGMNYLHQCNPPIIHRDLKSSNLLVDKNWTVKVGDFGLSRVRHETYLKTKTGKGTPQWMAPEILRNEQANEKSDVYSYGVVLWEITTEKIPWDDLNPMQVIGAVGYMNRQLEIPKDLDPVWASLIENCWCSEPESRPTFQEILYKLRDLQKKVAAERGK